MELRAITDDDVPAFRACMMNAFGDDTGEADPDGDRRFRALIAPGNAWAMFDGAQVVGVAGLYDLALGMPGGGSLGCAGLTMVGVRSTHRRRGILTQLMAAFDARAREYGHAIAGLWASEALIYGRYGFAIAAYDHVLEIADAHSLTVAAVAGGFDEMAWIEEGRAREVLPDIYARSTAQRPGVLRRDPVWWQERRFLESPFARRGASKRRHVIAMRDGAPVGYVQYRQRLDHHSLLPGGRVEIIELHGFDTRAVASLWRYVSAIDLHPTVFWPNTPVDDPLHLLVDDPRRLTRKRADSLWLRVDPQHIPRALAARTWSGELRLGIGDAVYDLPSGAKTSGRPHVTIAPQTLPCVLLGGLRPSELAAAGLASGDVMAADRAFATPLAPWCPEIF